MLEIKYTLIADGSSDRVLMNIIKWSLDNLFPSVLSEGQFADFRTFKNPPKNLADKITMSHNYFPSDILFIHRDSESLNIESLQERSNEIRRAINIESLKEKVVCIIPIKMTEAWLLIDSEAIKKAAGNRNYNTVIDIPALNRIEQEQQPKLRLHNILKQVSGLKGRNLQKFNIDKAVHLITENIQDFSSLRNLEAFKKFENDLIGAMGILGFQQES